MTCVICEATVGDIHVFGACLSCLKRGVDRAIAEKLRINEIHKPRIQREFDICQRCGGKLDIGVTNHADVCKPRKGGAIRWA